MRRTMLLMVLLAAALLALGGCERKVTTTIVQSNDFTGADACMKCHNDETGALLEAEGEWANSIHASGNNVDYTNRGGTGNDCTRCHDQQGFIKWVDSGVIEGPYDNVSAIGCFTCHDPHSRGNMSLRIESAYALNNGVVFDHGKGNLCVECHHVRTDVRVEIVDNKATTNRFGSHHGPQGDMLQGTGGWQFSTATYSSSGHATAVTDACVGCHMGDTTVHNGYFVGGHSFNMIQEETGYNLSQNCQTCHPTWKTGTGYDFKDTTTAAATLRDYDKDGVVEGFQTEFVGMMDSLGKALYAKSLVARTITGADTTYAAKTATIADKNMAGAVWNFVMLEEDRSEGIHNYKYAYDLIWNSINYVNAH